MALFLVMKNNIFIPSLLFPILKLGIVWNYHGLIMGTHRAGPDHQKLSSSVPGPGPWSNSFKKGPELYNQTNHQPPPPP